MTTKHKHYDLILAWAGGAKIQYATELYPDKWEDIETPRWNEKVDYRIKPKPKVKKSRWVIESATHGMFVSARYYSDISDVQKAVPGRRAVIPIPETMIEVEE